MQARNDAMEQLVSRLEAHHNLGEPFALICCTFRQFHRCEALHGPSVADQLIEAGQRCLLEHSPEGTSLVRTGPAELALVIPLTSGHATELTAMTQRLSNSCTIAPTSGTGDTPLLLTVAMGAARVDDGHPYSAGTLISQARLAMHQACCRPGNQWVLATPHLQQQADRLYRQQAALMQALQQGQFTAHLQPIVDLRLRRTVGFEALARWITADGRVITPQHFLPQAQAAGLTAALDLQVIAASLKAATRLSEARPSDQPLLISVNISAQLLESRCQREALLGLIDDHQRPDGIQLQLELVEEALNDSASETATELDALLQRLADRDVLIAIDDFGTGYSSLSRLHRLAINAIKIDRSFVQRINASPKPSNHLLDMLVAIGHDLGITLTAEGVETEQQRQWLLEHGIEQGQGYLFSTPLTLDAAIAALRATS